MKMKAVIFFGLLLGSFIYATAFAPSQHFTDADKAEFKKLLSSPKSHASLKNTYYSVSTLKKLNSEIGDKAKICESIKLDATDKEELFYAVAVSEALGCGHAYDKVDLKSALNSETFKDLYYGLSTALLLRANKKTTVDDKSILKGVEKLLTLGEADGTFKPSARDEPSVYYGGLALQALAQVASELKLSDNDKASFEEALKNAEDMFDSFSEVDDRANTLYLTDPGSKASNLKITATVFKGFTSLAKVLKQTPDTPSKEQVVQTTEYFIQRKSVSTPEDAYFVLEGITAAADSTLGIPVVISLGQGSISPSTSGTVNVHVTNVLGAPISSKLILSRAYPASASDKVLISNQEIAQDSKGIYSLNFLAAKPEPGFYNLEFRATPEKGSLAIPVDSAVRTLKVTTTVSVVDGQLIVSDSDDSQDIAEGRKYSVEHPKSVDGVNAEEFHHLVFNFKLKGQSGKAISAEQTFLRLSNNKNEHVVIAKTNGRTYTASIDLQQARHVFSAESGVYDLTLIVGGSYIHNSFTWKVASVNIKFSNGSVEAWENPFEAKNEIHHQFRAPEKRPDASISFAFTIAVVSPILVFLIGLMRVGANLGNYPSGVASLYALGFQASLGAILALYAFYWLQLNMMQTLRYLLILLIPAFFFGVKTLNALSAAKTKKD